MAAEVVFGHYRLVALLGRGGMGEVWRAYDTGKDRDVALKVLGAWLGAEPDYARRFRREAALAARLNSPNIIPIHDYGEIDGRLFMEMPLIDGVDLDALLANQGPLSPARAVGIIEQVADALDIAHQAGLVHRDVKPSNVLVTTRRGRDFVYLIDFGIARSLDSTSISHTGAVIGTLGYMAPERFEHEGDHRGDVYALACVLHTALTGQPPFTAPTGAFALGFYLDAHRSQPPPCPSRLVLDVPARFDTIIARGMAKKPADRYPTAGDLGTAALAALASPPAPAVPERQLGPGRDGQTEVRPTPTGAATPTTTAGRGTSPTDAPMTGEASGLDPDLSALPTFIAAVTTTAPRSVPAGHAASSPAPPAPPRRGWPRSRKILLSIGVSLALLAGLVTLLTTQRTIVNSGITERSLTGHTEAVWAVATAQLDGRPVVVSGSDDKTVRVWDMGTGQPIGAPFTDHTGAVWAVATAQLDGRPVVVSGSYDKTVRVSDLVTSQAIGTPFTGQTGVVNAVATSGSYDLATAQLDGRPVVISGGDDGTVRVWDLASAQPIGAPFTGHTDAARAVATAQLDGRPVVISGSDDKTVRVCDLATGQPIGAPFTGHTGTVWAVATAQLNGRPVVISGSDDKTLRVWDLATGQPIGAPFTGHTDAVHAVATAQLNGRPVVISGSDDKTVRVWDLEARTH